MRTAIVKVVGILICLSGCLFLGYRVFLYTLGAIWKADTLPHLLSFILKSILLGGLPIAILSLIFTMLFPRIRYFWGLAFVIPILLVALNGGPVWLILPLAFYLLSLGGAYLGLLLLKKRDKKDGSPVA